MVNMMYKFLFNLEYYDGPLKSVYNENDNIIIYIWEDQDNLVNYWYKVYSNELDVYNLVNNKISYNKLIMNSKKIEYINIDNQLNQTILKTLNKDMVAKTFKNNYYFKDDMISNEDSILIDNFIKNF